MNFLPEKKHGVPSHNFAKKNVLCEKGDEITRFDGTKLRNFGKHFFNFYIVTVLQRQELVTLVELLKPSYVRLLPKDSIKKLKKHHRSSTIPKKNIKKHYSLHTVLHSRCLLLATPLPLQLKEDPLIRKIECAFLPCYLLQFTSKKF